MEFLDKMKHISAQTPTPTTTERPTPSTNSNTATYDLLDLIRM